MMKELKGSQHKNMGVRTQEAVEEQLLHQPNQVSSMMGIGVGDVSLTFSSLFPIAIDSDTYLKNSCENLNVQSQTKKSK